MSYQQRTAKTQDVKLNVHKTFRASSKRLMYV